MQPTCYADAVGERDPTRIKKMLLRHRAWQGGGFNNDYRFFVFNNHPLISVFLAHTEHPFTRYNRLKALIFVFFASWGAAFIINFMAATSSCLECAPGCWGSMRSDGICQPACNDTEQCWNDAIERWQRGDCLADPTAAAPTTCEPASCPEAWRGDGACDASCNITACDFDCRSVGTGSVCDCASPDAVIAYKEPPSNKECLKEQATFRTALSYGSLTPTVILFTFLITKSLTCACCVGRNCEGCCKGCGSLIANAMGLVGFGLAVAFTALTATEDKGNTDVGEAAIL